MVSSNTAVATVPASVTPTQAGPDDPYIANVTVTAIAQGEAIITVTDKKGNQRTVAISVAPPPGSFTYTGEVATHRIAVGGRYTVTATGASGGDGWLGARGGIGATAQADFVLSAGTDLTIVVGGRGTSYLHPNTSSQSGGGGGGSFVFVAPTAIGAQPLPIVIGGGGGGAGQGGGSGGLTDPTGAAGGGASCCGGSAGGPGPLGLGGFGGTYTYQGLGGGGGGAGMFGAGGAGLGSGGVNSLGGGSYASTPRFAGGVPCDFGGGLGGFGGGGAGCGLSGGGGGGYSGGGGGGGWSAGGGGSYVNTTPAAGAPFTFVAGTNSLSGGSTAGDGAVTITFKGQ
jgi:hypothetical protein